MKSYDYDNEKVKLTVKEILLTFCDGIAKFEEIFGYHWQRREAFEYWRWRELDKERFYHSLRRLEKQGYIKRYQEEKKHLIRLTVKGEKKASQYLFNDLEINKPKSWDKKWRIVIFDIPKDKKALRDIVRERLKRWGFYQLQKSVFVFPYDCQEMIAALKYFYGLNQYLQYIIAEKIETELDLVSYFYDKGIIKNK